MTDRPSRPGVVLDSLDLLIFGSQSDSVLVPVPPEHNSFAFPDPFGTNVSIGESGGGPAPLPDWGQLWPRGVGAQST